ncbi:MAG: InlB B-repeat-containing protein, partial [Clostridia bacterium]|nr:InlB B-repeat-containing protein [Clostridia bacterium]
QYTIGSALNDSNRALLTALRGYGARAQEYFDYRTDRLADGDYVIANLKNGVFEDGTKVGVFKPGESVSATSLATSFVSGAQKQWYVSTSEGVGQFYEGGQFTAPTENCTVTSTVMIVNEDFDSRNNNSSGECSSAGVFSPNNKGDSSYVLRDDGNGGKYIWHYKAPESGHDSQMDSANNSFDIQEYVYSSADTSFADKKLTVTVKLARTEADVATAKFNLRHYKPYSADSSVRHSDYTTNVFSFDSTGTVMLGGKLPVGNLSSEWQEYSFVVDFGAGDAPETNNLFAYRNGLLIGSVRVEDFTTEKFLVYTDPADRVIVNFHTTGTREGELLFDDIRINLGKTPVSPTRRGVINYVLNGGKLPIDTVFDYEIGEENDLAIPEKENYDFVGWYTSSAFDEDAKIESFVEYEHKTVTLYAKFTPKAEYIDSLKAANDAFATEDFYRVDTDNEYNLSVSAGGNGDKYALVDYGEEVYLDRIVTMNTSSYEPSATPAGKSHPYLFFTADDVGKLLETLNSSEFYATAGKFWSYANTKDFTGEFPQWSGAVADDGPERWSTDVLAVLEAKAFAYIVTGDPSYGYEAIIGAKNAMLTLDYSPRIHMDPYHGASQTMVTVAKVFDWCYDLMSDADKLQIVLGVQNLMCPTLEYNLFQKEQGLAANNPVPSAVNGHGTGPQFIRDYVTVALAFYTEESSWWDFIGGRYLAEYAPVMDYAYNGAWASQGTATYGTSKYFINMWAAWVIRSSTGLTPSYAVDDGAGGREAAYFINSHIMGNDRYFSTGDGGRYPNGSSINYEYMLLAAAFYKDPALEAFAKYYTNGYSKWSYSFTEEMTAPMTLVFGSFFCEDVPEGEYENRGDGVDMLQYFSSPNGFMSARNSWDSDAAVTFMKIGEMTMANHDIADHGTFQIYYKGLLAGSSGAYKKYGSYVHKYYLQATVAHNGLLVFDPALADSEPVYGTKAQCKDETCTHETCTIDYDNITNAARYYYSGSQKAFPSMGNSVSEWTDGRATTGKVYGHEVAYNEDGSSKFAYIAGDITPSYSSATVKYVGRRMLTVYTGDPDYPMLFFTFDQMTSVTGGENFTKTFLLHTMKEPEVDTEAKTAFITDGEGKLVLHSLSGADSIRKIGGEGYAYWINGKNCLDQYAPSDNYDNIWGRIELNATGDLSDSFLTAMYVTDAENEQQLDVRGYETDVLKFAVIHETVVGFIDSTEERMTEFSLGVMGDGLYEYYISGLKADTWTVRVDGVTVASVTVSEEGGIANFKAPGGKVTLTPEIEGVEYGKINYVTNGGILPADAVEYYSVNEETPITAVPTRGIDEFLGWYASESCADGELVSKLPAGLGGGTVTLYAKWRKVLINERYDSTSVAVPESTTSTIGSITYNAGSSGELKAGSTHYTVTSGNNTYLRVTSTGKNSCVYASSSGYNLTNFTETAVSYEFDVAKLAGYSTGNLTMMITTSRGSYGTLSDILTFTTAKKYSFFGDYVTTVKLSGTTVSGITVSESFTTIRMTIDFAESKVYLYNADGSVLASAALSVPTAASGYTQPANLAEWQKLAKPIFFRVEVNQSSEGTSCALAFDNIKVTEGRAFAKSEASELKNYIKYVPNGGTLDATAMGIYSSTETTALPTNIKNGDKIFGGWYTTPTFDAGTRVTEIAAGTSGVVTLYAKWIDPMLVETFDVTELDFAEGLKAVGPYTYNANNSGCSVKTVFDADGNTYLVATNSYSTKTGNTNGIVFYGSNSYNLTHFTETAISYELKLRKAKDVPLSTLGMSLPSSGGNQGIVSILSMNKNGELRLSGSSTLLGTVNEKTFVTLKITIDFAAGKIYAYDALGNVLAQVTPTVPTVKTGTQPTTLAEWQKIAQNYLFYISYSNPESDRDPASSIIVDDIKIVEGRLF